MMKATDRRNETGRLARVLAAALPVLAALAAPAGAATNGFRGDGSGQYPDAALPAEWSATNGFVWKVKIPSWSNASPAPAGDRLFICTEPAVLLCVSTVTGSNVWQTTNGFEQVASPEEWEQYKAQKKKADEFGGFVRAAQERLNALAGLVSASTNKSQITAAAEVIDAKLKSLCEKWEPVPLVPRYTMAPTHGSNGYSSPTPVTDGRQVWALFGNGVAACYTVDGTRRWIKLVDHTKQGYGHSASPVLADGKLIVAINDVHALNADTGETVWRVPSVARFGTPAVTSIGGQNVLVTANGEIIRVADGKVLASKLAELGFNGPIVADGTAFFVNEGRVRAMKLPGEITGDTVKAEKAWETGIVGARQYASPVCCNGLVFGLNEGGMLTVLDAKTGQKVLERKLNLNGVCYTSLTLVRDRLIAFSEGGSAVVLQPDRECKELARHTFETVRSTPVPVGARMYIRGLTHLYCIGQ